MSIPWKDFNSSYATRSRFYLKITRVNLNENRKDRGVEVSTSSMQRPSERGRQVGLASLHLWPIFVALLQTCRLGVWRFRKVALVKLMEDVGRPAKCRPHDLNSLQNSFEFLWNVGLVLLIWIHCALSEWSEQGCGWHTHVHQPQEHKEEQLFIFISFKTKWSAAAYNWMN